MGKVGIIGVGQSKFVRTYAGSIQRCPVRTLHKRLRILVYRIRFVWVKKYASM